MKALSDFKEGRVAILVATDIAARGLDIEQLPHVVNFELPMVPEDYVHRIGRTGRAGIDGQAISLVCVDETPLLRAIQGLLKRVIPSEVIAGFEPDRHIRPEPIRLRSTPAERAERAAALRQAGPARHAGAAREETAATSVRGIGAMHAGGHGGGRGPGRGAPQGDRRGRPAGDRPGESRRREESFVARPARQGPDAGRGHGAPGARSGGPRRSGRGQGTAVPGTGFGNVQSGQRPGAHDRSGAPHARSGGGHGRPAAGHGRPAAGHGGQGQPRTLPGERLHRAGGQGS